MTGHTSLTHLHTAQHQQPPNHSPPAGSGNVTTATIQIHRLSTLLPTVQVRDAFFDKADQMVATLWARGQDPNDKEVPYWPWKRFCEIPGANLYNMDEVGSDPNKGRKKTTGHVDEAHDGLQHRFAETDGDNNPFHVTNCLTTRADGTTPIPPMLGHSNPASKAKSGSPKISRSYLKGLWVDTGAGGFVNTTGISVFVTKSGSMTKDRFPAFCHHFVQHLPEGQGKGGEPVVLVFDGHASRWNYSGLQYLMKNNVFCLCLPGHTSVWAQPNDGGPNASFKSTLADKISAWRHTHRALPGIQALIKMTRADFNAIFAQAWLTWTAKQRAERASGGNSIMTGWRGTGLYPFNREAPYWSAAIAKFGQREELAQSHTLAAGRTHALGANAPTALSPPRRTAALQAAFAAVVAKHAPRLGTNRATEEMVAEATEAAEESTTAVVGEQTAGAAATEETVGAAATEEVGAAVEETAAAAMDEVDETDRTNFDDGEPEDMLTEEQASALKAKEAAAAAAAAAAPLVVPASASSDVVQSAVLQVRQEAKVHGFKSRLENMETLASITLQNKSTDGSTTPSTLVALADSYLLVRSDGTQETLRREDAAVQLAARFDVPAQPKGELALEEAAAVRKREALQAAAAREAEQRAAIEAATTQWHEQQAELAWELGITFEGWQRIVALLSKPPPVRVGGLVVMNSVAAGRSVVIDAAVQDAIAAPLHESVRAAAERADEQGKKQGREVGVTQDPFGIDVSSIMPTLEEANRTASANAEAKRKRKEARTCDQAAKADEKLRDACRKLLSGRAKGDPAECAIGALIVLIKWRNGKVPANTKAENKAAVVAAWRAVEAPVEELRARAGAEAGAAAPAAPKNKTKRRKAVDSSDEEEADDDEDTDEEESERRGGTRRKTCNKKGGDDSESEDESDESDESDEDEDGDEEEEDGEPKYDVKCIHAQKGKGKTLQYQVEWDGWAELTWEPGSFMLSTFALREWEESGKAAWEASKKQQPKK